ncbi:TPA: hypothetical protein ACHQNL_001367 [Serratia marcescens]|uniref:hypothetical protein n=1 Tax=Serratia TaxID=613 RepID=UPI00215B3608|nr:hypothetical protein [Serratia marcescens]MDS0779134.1 hypothetical protein [Serratia marcescens]BEO08432.1 hypothetical protein SMQC15_13440 [Serratia marcescens]
MDNKLSELKDALEFLETTEFDGEWDSALVGGENGKNYHAVINANDVVVRADDDSRHTSWLCDYLEAVSPVNIRALLAELEAKDKRIVSIERINQAQDDHINQQQDRIDSLEKTNAGLGQRLGAAENRLATPVPTVKFAGYGLYHAERDEFGSWLKATPQGNCSDAITKHGYVNVKLFTAPPEPAVPDDYFGELVKKARSAADKAMRKFPQPNYVLNKVAEESGEVIKAVIHYTEGREEWGSVEGEIIDNLAMLIRLVVEGDQVIGFTPPEACRGANLPAPHEPDPIDVFVAQVCGDLSAGHQR